jgi:predicted amidohydrolase YtcJ
MRVVLGVLFAATMVAGCEAPAQTAERVFVNGAVYTVDADRSWAEAIAVNDGHIVFVGSTSDSERWIGEQTEVTDLQGQMLLPGFHDSHTHILIGVATDGECDLLRIESVEAVEAKLRECTELEGFGEENWILGGGWSDWLWPKSEPNKAILDELFPDRPVYLGSSFGHSGWVNSRALELAGIHAESRAGPDGIIVRDPETGEATGALHDSASMLIDRVVPEMTEEHRRMSVLAAVELAHRNGITAVIEPGVDEAILGPLLQVADMGLLDLRSLVSLSPINWRPGVFDDGVFEMLDRRDAWRRPNIDVDSVKIYMDGVIESGTGALLEPYEDELLGFGPRYYTQEKVDEYFSKFDAMGLQIHVHAIGDAGVRMALDGIEAARSANGEQGNRHHFTHLQLIHDDDIPRFGELNVGASFQALWAYPDPAAIELDIPMLGRERTWQMYPIGSIHASGGRINGASDYWVTDINPLLAIEVALTRQDPYTNDGPVLDEDESVDLATMIDAYTINGAYTMSLEDEQGSIEVGKRADLVVLDRNLFEIPVSEISDANVTMTIFDGRTVYHKPE